MTVGELIQKLSLYPLSMTVAIRDDCDDDSEEYETIDIEQRVGDDEIIMVIK